MVPSLYTMLFLHIGRGSWAALVELRNAHGDPQRMLQVFLGTSLYTRFLLLVQALPPELVHAVREAFLHQKVVHLQTAKNHHTQGNTCELSKLVKHEESPTRPLLMQSYVIVLWFLMNNRNEAMLCLTLTLH
jgi:hypothetical protein